LHDSRDLCVAAAVAPVGADRWSWISSLPHARPGTAPLSGPHTATNAEGATDLVARLRDLVEVRRRAASAGPGHLALAVLPAVIAVIDDRLGARDAEYVSAAGPPLGVHVLRLLRPSDRPPPSCAICVDVDPAGAELGVRIAGRPEATRNGVPDGVALAYTRDLANTLADT
jgi:hypothetical protein